MKRKLIKGVDLVSYIQILASDKQTCILRLQQDNQIAILCMKNGDLLDAQTKKRGGKSTKYREDAVIEMLGWPQPEIELLPLTKPIKKQITKSLEFLLLESCRFQDENQEYSVAEPFTLEDQQFFDDTPFDSMSLFIDDLKRNKNIVAYLILDLQGNIVLKKDRENILNADFLSFVQFTLNSYSSEILPETNTGHNINFILETNKTIMIYSLQNHVLGLVVNPQIEFGEVNKQINPLLSYLQNSKAHTITSGSL